MGAPQPRQRSFVVALGVPQPMQRAVSSSARRNLRAGAAMTDGSFAASAATEAPAVFAATCGRAAGARMAADSGSPQLRHRSAPGSTDSWQAGQVTRAL